MVELHSGQKQVTVKLYVKKVIFGRKTTIYIFSMHIRFQKL